MKVFENKTCSPTPTVKTSSSTSVQKVHQPRTRAMMHKIESLYETDSFLHGRKPHSSQASKKVITFDITSSSELRQFAVIDSRPKSIVFRSHAKFPDFKGNITVEFQPLTVLGTEKVFFEIVPETVVMKYNRNMTEKAKSCDFKKDIIIGDKFTAGEKLEGIHHGKGVQMNARIMAKWPECANGRIVTPVLHIDRQNGSPFLRPVKVTLPLMDDETLQHDIKQSKLKMGDGVRLTRNGNNIQFQQTKFSPVAGVHVTSYDPVRSLLEAFCFTGDSSLDFETKGVYFIAKQTTADTVEIDLRRFRSWQEHRTYRMDETAVYFLATNPAAVQPLDHGSKVNVCISGQYSGVRRKRKTRITMKFPHPESSVDTWNRKLFETPIATMRFPNPDISTDDTARNRRDFELPITLSEDVKTIAFELSIKFDSSNLNNYNLIENEMVHFYTPNEYERLQSITQPSYTMLLRVVGNISSIPVLIELLVEYIECVPRSDVEHLSDFILKDIKETVDELHLTEEQVIEFVKSLQRRFSSTALQFTHRAILEDWFSGYRNKSRLGMAKQDILGLLNRLQLAPEQRTYLSNLRREYLLEQSCSVLTDALLYVPVDRLKNGLKKAKEDKLIKIVHTDLIDFIHDRTHDPME